MRQVFNIAQVYEMKDKVKLLTFDADDTIYEHGMDLLKESWIVSALCALMECGTSPFYSPARPFVRLRQGN